MTKLTQQDLITLYLAARPGVWVNSYELSKKETERGWLGSSGERRAREIAEAGKHTVGGATYFIEKRQQGKYAQYRVVSGVKVKREQIVETLADNSVRISYREVPLFN